MRRLRTLALMGAATCLAAGCGGSKPATRRGPSEVSVVMATAPDSLDPAVGSNPEALEADWLVYTPLLTYPHADGLPGAQVIAGLASASPTIGDGGLTYTLSLRPGLAYTDGQAVRASDFLWAVERAIKLGWREAPQLITSRIVGAEAFAAGRSKTISGITTDDATGSITIHLTTPWGPFENVLALPALAPVPRTTPLRNQPGHPPPGVGPYEFGRLAPGHAFSLNRNPHWSRTTVPGIPVGHVDVTVDVTGSARSDAVAVLDNRADAFDSADEMPASLLPLILRQASDRYSKQPVDGTYLIFMNGTRRPFSSLKARIAVQTALDEGTLKRLGPGSLQEGCFLIPPDMVGHSHDQCPRGNIEKGGNLAAARALVAQSGMAGTPVTVWSETAQPAAAWMTYYRSLLNQLGLKAQLRSIPAATYLKTIGKRALHPQTGFGELSAGLPTPLDFYQRLTGTALRDRDNENWGEVDDSYLNRQVRILSSVPSDGLVSVAGFWHSLERYVADRAYAAVFGYATDPQFVSDRLLFRRLVLSPVAGLDWSSFQLK